MPCSTLDYFPTLVDLLDSHMPDNRPIDGISLMPILLGETAFRRKPIPYRFVEVKRAMFGSPTFAVIDERYKFLSNLSEDRSEDMVFDLVNDPYEQNNLINNRRDFTEKRRESMIKLMADFRRSHFGGDYHDPSYIPVNEFQEISQGWSCL